MFQKTTKIVVKKNCKEDFSISPWSLSMSFKTFFLKYLKKLLKTEKFTIKLFKIMTFRLTDTIFESFLIDFSRNYLGIEWNSWDNNCWKLTAFFFIFFCLQLEIMIESLEIFQWSFCINFPFSCGSYIIISINFNKLQLSSCSRSFSLFFQVLRLELTHKNVQGAFAWFPPGSSFEILPGFPTGFI